MPISNTNRKAGPFVGDDTTTVFPFAFKVFSDEDLLVVRADSLGDETDLILDTDFTVALNADQDASPGGDVILSSSPLGSGYTLVISSKLQNLQPVDLTNQGGFYTRVITNALDRLTILIQQLAENVARSLKMGISTPEGVDAQLPSPIANHVLGWNDAGTAIINYVAQAGTSLIDLGAAWGASLIGFIQTGSGAVLRTLQDKSRETVSVNDFGALGGAADDATALLAAIASFGGNSGLLIVNAPVTLKSDVTIPANVALRVEGRGLISIQTGRRLRISGAFTADPLHRCFNAELLSTTITASVNGNALNVTTASAAVLAAGQVLSGSGVALGTTIANAYGNTGTGQYALNNYNGVIASESMTVTGASITFDAGIVETVYPEWFGAIADGVTDCTAAVQHAAYSVAWGGTVKFRAASYLVTAPTIVHGAQAMVGQGVSDTASGSPPPAITHQTYIYTTTDNSSIFILSGRCNHTTIRNIAFGAAAAPYTNGAGIFVPVGTGRKAITLNGHAPQFIFGGVVDNCYFYNLQIGILCQDSWAPNGDGYAPAGYYWSGSIVSASTIAQGNAYEIVTVGTTNWAAITGTVLSGTIGTVGCRFVPNATAPTGNGTAALMPAYHDWGVNPYKVEHCQFMGNSYGIYLNTNNADAWRIIDSVFILPPSGQGVRLMRSGYLKLDTCFAFGASQADSDFIYLVSTGANALDELTLDGCQAEYCSHFLLYATGATQSIPPIINVRNSIHQLGADIYLASPCEYNSEHNEIQSFVYVDSSGIRINTINDQFMFQNFSSGPTWAISLVSGNPNTIQTYLPGKYPASNLPGPIIGGLPLYGTTGTVTPVGNVTPTRLGQEYLNTASGQWYKSIGLTNGNWVLLN